MLDRHPDLKRFTRILTLPLARLESPPVRVESLPGKGLHLLLHSRAGGFLHLTVFPAEWDQPAYSRTATAALAYQGTKEPTPEQTDWLAGVTSGLTEAGKRTGWEAFLQWAAGHPAAALPSSEFDPEGALAPGNQELLRITTRCNARCAFCSARGVLEDLVRDPALIRRRLVHMHRQGIRMASFTGGEPTLVQGLDELVAAARQVGMDEIDVQTNGLLLARPERVRRLVAHGMTSIFLSLHSADPATHDGMLQVPGAFDKAMACIEHCLEAGVEVRTNCVLTTRNLEGPAGPAGLVELIARLHGGAGAQVNLSFVALQGWALDHPELVPRLSEAAPRMQEAIDTGLGLGMDVRIPGLCGIPVCQLPGYERHFDEIRDGGSPPRLTTRGYGPACDACPHRASCSGFWKVYLDRFGTGELFPRAGGNQVESKR